MAAVRNSRTHSKRYGLTSGQGTALSIALEPILCCRLFLSTHDAVRGVRNGQNGDPATIAADATLLRVQRRNKLYLDSMGYPGISGVYSLLFFRGSCLNRCGAYFF
jgi:hypothetical protein